MSERPAPAPAAERGSTHALRIALRSAQMVRAAIAAAVVFARDLVRRGPRSPGAFPGALGSALVRLCTKLGATFIKIGQIASTRSDLLPPALIAELVTLQDQVPAFPFAAVRETIERELGRPLADVFSRFEEEPVAAASVAQVHRAVLRENGDVVAVKVRRPDILEKVALDRSILLFTGRLLERLVPTLRLVSLEGALRTFCDAVARQIHLENEARNNQRFTANFADDPGIHFPRTYPTACSDAVLTMEYVDGVPESQLAESGIDVRELVAAGMRCVCRMIFLHGFVHSDLHPGNLRFLAPARLVLLDLGLVGEITDEDRVMTARTLFALATGDGVTVARMFYDNSPSARVRDYSTYEAEIVAFVDDVRRRGLARLQVTAEIGRIFDILRRHRIQARSHMTMANLAMMTAEGIGKRLAPEMSLTDEALPYLAEALGLPASSVPPGTS